MFTNDANSTTFITMRNIDTLTSYVKSRYGSNTRVILSEQGFSSTGGQANQAAALALAYYKAACNPMIDVFIVRSYKDEAHEVAQGLAMGLKDANGKKKTVQVTGVTDKKMKSLTIPAAVTIQWQKYKVTAIKASAFKNMKKLTKVVIGKNVNKVGGNAFSGCKKLKNIVIQSKAWKKNSLGKKAFYKIAAKPKFKVPAKKLKAYKKYIKKSKVAKKAKITK